MTESEYSDFLTFLFERYVRPRIGSVRHRHHDKYTREEEFHYFLDHAVRAGKVFKFIESYCFADSWIYSTLTTEGLKWAISETRNSLEFSNYVAEEAGFLDAFEAHEREIASHLDASHLPVIDKEVLQEMGSVNADQELRSLVFIAKTYLERRELQSRELTVRQELRHIESLISEAEAEFERDVEPNKNQGALESPRKSRRWFKGLGQIGQGAALTIANVALAIGTLNLPVSPETQTWGAIASVTTGIGTILSGAGDLRGE